MTHAQVDVVEFEPSPLCDELQQAEADKYLNADVDELKQGQGNIRPTTVLLLLLLLQRWQAHSW